MISREKLCVVYRRDEIADAVKRLAEEIEGDYKDRNPVLIGILKGAFVFLSDLVRQMDFSLEVEFVRFSSYKSGTESSGRIDVIQDVVCDVSGRNVIIVEDIVDTGQTVKYLLDTLRERGAASVKVCALSAKPSRRKYDVNIDYLGFIAPDKFLVGYGLDYDEKYRNLPDICYVEGERYGRESG
jgi:hypoxanthine phosphoribosyltransferase